MRALAIALVLAGCAHARTADEYRVDTAKALSAQDAFMTTCYDKVLASAPTAAGTVTVVFAVEKTTGRIADASVDPAKTTAPDAVQACVLQVMPAVVITPADSKRGLATWAWQFSSQATADTTSEQDDASLDLQEHDRHHHHGGIAMFIAMSLDGLNVSPEQRDAIAKIEADMHVKLRASRDAEKALLLALADGVAAGAVDRAALDPQVARLAAESAKVPDAVADSLDALHAALTPLQRQALADKVEAHLAVWHRENAGKGRHLDQLAADLGLSAQQVDTIRAAYEAADANAPHYDRGEAEAQARAFAEAFTKEPFDAHASTTAGSVTAHMASWGTARTINLYGAAAPVLTPEQRAKAADLLRQHANYKHGNSES